VQVRPDVWIHVDPRVEIEASFLEKQLRFDRDEVELLWQLLQPGMTIVDVGAFVGVMSLVAARRVGPHGRVVAFEPGSHSIVRFAANKVLNRADNVTIVAAAAGDRYGSIPYYYRHTCPDQSSVGYHREAVSNPIIVPVVPLDEILGELELRQIDFIKIDVEGAEPSVISGAKQILGGARAPMLVIEINPGALGWAGNSVPELVNAISALGYELWVLEVAKSEAYVNAIGIKAEHRERFSNLADCAISPLLTHNWYQKRFPRQITSEIARTN
jgi:FkbM family methyltransferase